MGSAFRKLLCTFFFIYPLFYLAILNCSYLAERNGTAIFLLSLSQEWCHDSAPTKYLLIGSLVFYKKQQKLCMDLYYHYMLQLLCKSNGRTIHYTVELIFLFLCTSMHLPLCYSSGPYIMCSPECVFATDACLYYRLYKLLLSTNYVF